MLSIPWHWLHLATLLALQCWHGRCQDATGWSPVKNMPQRDTAPYFALIRTDYKFRLQNDYVTYSIDILIDPCRDLVRTGGIGSACCKDQSVAGCQHHPDVEAGQDLQVAYMQNAHIASCRGTDFEYDPNCGTYLEVHRPGTKEVLSDVRIDATSFPSGYQTVFLATHRLCRGQYEVWWVVRTRSGPYVQRTRGFYVSLPTCETPPGGVDPPQPLLLLSDMPWWKKRHTSFHRGFQQETIQLSGRHEKKGPELPLFFGEVR